MRKYMSKRQRPCDFCRSRKSACRIEGQPPCRLCLLHGRECTFVEAAQPRKKPSEPPTTDVVLSHEHAIDTNGPGLDVQRIQNDISASPTGDALVIDAPTVPTRDPSAGSGFPDMGMDFLYDPAMDGSEYQFMFRTPRSPASNMSHAGHSLKSAPIRTASPARSQPSWRSTNDVYLDDAETTNSEILGLSGDMDPYLLQRYQTDEAGVFKFKQLAIHSVQDTPIPLQFLVSRPSIFAQSRQETGHVSADQAQLRFDLEQIVSVEMGSRLIKLYEKFIAPQYPIFSTQAPPDAALSPVHLLAAIYSIAFPFYIHDDRLCIDLAYDSLPHSALGLLINRALAQELHSPSLAGVQALILVVARPSSNHLISDASYRWAMLGLTVASAMNVGIHLDPSSWKIAPWQAAQRRRVSASIYTLDRWLAASLGRPPHIDEANWMVTSACSADYLDSGLTTNQSMQALDFSALTRTLSKTLSQL